jgi:hypothetical protein
LLLSVELGDAKCDDLAGVQREVGEIQKMVAAIRRKVLSKAVVSD